MVTPDPQRENAQNISSATKWLLLFVVATLGTIFLALALPNGSLLTYPARALILYTQFRLHDLSPSWVGTYPTPLKITAGYFAGTDTYVEEMLAVAITGVYFGIIFSLVSSKQKRQIYAAIGLIIVYVLGLCRVLLSAIAMMS
jgi:hypothetical protein